MTPQKQKGTRFETEVVKYLRDHGFPSAERRALAGAQDKGDIAGVHGWVIEAKNRQRLDLAGAVDEARAEHANDPHACWYAAVIKRPRRNVADAYVVMPLHQFAAIAGEL